MSLSTRTPMTDTQRVLGQIERGEVRADADAARQIAARHQAAYGNDVWGPTTKGPEPVSNHAGPHPLAGQTITITAHLPGHGPGPHQYVIEDWNDRVFGEPWLFMQGHPASLAHATRAARAGLPLNNEVVYGHVRGRGLLVHVEEIPGGAA